MVAAALLRACAFGCGRLSGSGQHAYVAAGKDWVITDGNGVWDLAFRIMMLVILLVPALSCVYMEGFRRQCERHWQAIDKAQAGE